MTFEIVLERLDSNISELLDYLKIKAPYTVEPTKEGFGDIVCNVAFLLAKEMKKSPKDIAIILAKEYETKFKDGMCKVVAHPSGYLNFRINMEKFAGETLKKSMKNDYANGNEGKNITIEHTSVNPNKAIHIGHVRNMIIGDVISRILIKAGNKVHVLNYIDDSGLQVADIILGFKELKFSQDSKNEKFDHYCGDTVYVNTTKQYETKPELKIKRDKILEEMDDVKSDTAKFANEITKKILEQQIKTCWRLGVTYDCLNFESQIIQSGMWSEIFERLKTDGTIIQEKEGENAGCWIHRDGDYDKIVVRSNGIATYFAKDIPYAMWKMGLITDPFRYVQYSTQYNDRVLWQTILGDEGEKRDFTGKQIITIIDNRQSQLQDMITKLMSKINNTITYTYLGYEVVTLSSTTAKQLGIDTSRNVQMSGRKGTYINADTVLDTLYKKTLQETQKRNPDLKENQVQNIANDLATGALRYEMIKQDLDRKIIFDLDESLNLHGDTAAYIQYSHTRANRILEKSKNKSNDSSLNNLTDKHERSLIIEISKFKMHVSDATRNLSPKIIAKYCHTLAVAFNSFYEHVRIIDEKDQSIRVSRLYLVESFQKTLLSSLYLLGIPVPDRM